MATPTATRNPPPLNHHLRFHLHLSHLAAAFGSDWFGQKAETFARFFGTPTFLLVQTGLVGLWMWVNIVGYTHFDPYPFILLNLAFSLQAAYAAPLILLAQTRQADRDKAHADADAQHREALAQLHEEHLSLATQQAAQIMALLQQNTQLTEAVKAMSERIETLTREVHGKVLNPPTTP